MCDNNGTSNVDYQVTHLLLGHLLSCFDLEKLREQSDFKKDKPYLFLWCVEAPFYWLVSGQVDVVSIRQREVHFDPGAWFRFTFLQRKKTILSGNADNEISSLKYSYTNCLKCHFPNKPKHRLSCHPCHFPQNPFLQLYQDTICSIFRGECDRLAWFTL